MISTQKTIAFGVAGEGRGHAARTIALSEILQESYHIVIFAPSTIRDFLASELPGVEIIDIPAIAFHKENHVIRYRKTLIKNLVNITSLQPGVSKIADQMKNRSIDALISDFEPFTALAAANLGIPVLNLNHPGVVLRYFSLKPDALAAKLTAMLMMPSGTRDLICSFYGGDIGPIIRKDIRNTRPVQGSYFLVYAKDESRDAVTAALKKFPGTKFIVFPDKNRNFTDALTGCRGVISSGGHQMLSEALFLKKPVLAFPQRMQFEQRLNAIMLEKSGWGLHGDIHHIHKSIMKFISSIDEFPYMSSLNDNYLFSDFTPAAADCIRNFVENSNPECAAYRFGMFALINKKPVRSRPA